MDSVRKLLDEP